MQLIRRRKRGITPVVATILMIALTIAAGAVIVAVLSTVQQRSNLVDTSDTDIGIQGGDELQHPLINITKLSRNTFLQVQGIDDFVEITIEVTNFNLNPIYILDVDFIVFGEKLDEIEQWSIVSFNGPASYTTKNGEFAGYKQNFGSTVNYVVRLQDVTVADARIPANTNFIYEVIYGSEPGIVTNSVQKMKISEIIFNPVFYNIALFHYGSSFLFDDAAGQYEETINGLNGTNKLFFKYNRAQDAYDYKNNPGSINATYINLNYDLVIVDVWAVPTVIADKLWEIHQNGTSLVFYGSVYPLDDGGDVSDVKANIDANKTELITGLVPNHYDPNIYPRTGSGSQETKNGYQFDSGNDPILAGLSGQSFEEKASLWGLIAGDTTAYDAANMTAQTNLNITSFGDAYYELKRSSSPPYWTHDGPLLVNKAAVVNGTGGVYSFVWKHNEELAFQSSTITNPSHLTAIRRNMLTVSFLELERTTSISAELEIRTLDIVDISNQNTRFAIEFTSEVTAGYIAEESLRYILDMPDAISIRQLPFFDRYEIYVDIDNDGSWEIQNAALEIQPDNIIDVDVGALYNESIPQGNIIKVRIPGPGDQFRMFDSNTNALEWVITASYNVIGLTSKSFIKVIDSNADTTPPSQVTGLTATTTSSSSIELNWDENPEPDVSFYRIYRDGSEIATVNDPTTTFDDSGLAGNTNYTYRVSAVDDAAIPNEGPLSDPAWAVTTESDPPAKVTGLTSVVFGSSRIDLSWDPNSETDLDHYNVYRNGSKIIETTTNSYSDSGLLAETTYEYRVSAVDTNGNEGIQSNSEFNTTGSTTNPPPAQVQNLIATASSTDQIDLTWDPNSESDLSYYIVYRDGVQIDTTTSTSYSDTGLTEGTSYTFEVAAVDDSFNQGAKSDPATATTFGKMHVEDIILTYEGARGGFFSRTHEFTADVTILDSFGNPVAGVTVEVTVYPNVGSSNSGTGVTDQNGIASVFIDGVGNFFSESFTGEVTDVQDTATMVYDPSANVKTTDSVVI